VFLVKKVSLSEKSLLPAVAVFAVGFVLACVVLYFVYSDDISLSQSVKGVVDSEQGGIILRGAVV